MSKPMQWLPELDAQLRQLAGTMANTDVAAKMSRTLRSIEHRASRLGISLAFIVERNRPWSREDDETLRSQAGTKPPAEIAAALGRTEDAVIHRGIVIGVPMGFKRTPRYRQRWDEIRVLVDEGLAPPQIARRMGLPIRAIRQRLGAMGLRAKADGRGCAVRPALATLLSPSFQSAIFASCCVARSNSLVWGSIERHIQ